MSPVHKPPKAFDFGELRSLLQQAPSAARWDQLCALVSQRGWSREAAQWMDYAESTLDHRWPDALRTWPADWWRRERQPPAIKLVRAYHLHTSPKTLDAIVETIASARPGLTILTLMYCYGLTAAQAETLATTLGETLRVLALMGHDSGALLDSLTRGALRRVEQLKLAGQLLQGERLNALLALPTLPALRALHLESMSAGNPSPIAALLTDGPLPGQLERLTLEKVLLDAAPLATRRWDRLTALTMHRCDMHAQQVGAMLAQMPALRQLDLLGVPLAAEPELWLDHAPQLEGLHLRDTLGEPGAATTVALLDAQRRLLAHPALDALRALALTYQHLDRSALAQLVSRLSGQLERLELSHLYADEALWDALSGTRWPALKTLTLHNAAPASRLCAALCSMDMPALRQLDLQFVQLSEHDRAALERAPWRAQLTRPY
jgi:hypothetical protein